MWGLSKASYYIAKYKELWQQTKKQIIKIKIFFTFMTTQLPVARAGPSFHACLKN
jgi:hypothetical protein